MCIRGGGIIYTGLAAVYDKLMHDVDYSNWADYMETIFKMHETNPSLILDLGCGTGNLSIELAKRGYDMIGIDISAEMLSCAKIKSVQQSLDILYINQDMSNFELYGTVDVVLSMMDSINYITHKNDLKSVFKLVNNYLNPGGLFIFDINTPYKLKTVLGDNVFYEVGEEITYIWTNRYHKTRKICEFDLTFFIRNGQHYFKTEETHYERAYSVKEIKDVIASSGMELLEIYDDLSLKAPSPKSERIFFVCKK